MSEWIVTVQNEAAGAEHRVEAATEQEARDKVQAQVDAEGKGLKVTDVRPAEAQS